MVLFFILFIVVLVKSTLQPVPVIISLFYVIEARFVASRATGKKPYITEH